MSTIQQLTQALCTGCGACEQVCPCGAIAMQADAEGFLRPVIQADACVDCGLCARTCPVLEPTTTSGASVAYAARAREDALREVSSSGGVFSLLAMEVLNQGGVVFGAVFDEDFRVVHRVARDPHELVGLRGSKYVQSRIGDTFRQAKEYLEDGTTVLFSGTPCQIEGLHKYLQHTYDHLITQDLICHGVPSPMVWDKYVQEQEKAYRSSLCGVNFRHKSPSWRRYSLQLHFCNTKTYTAMRSDDPYMRSFLQDLTLRPSCYQCPFKKLHRVSDITLADFWGVQECAAHMDDDRGTSLVICHTDKGRAWFNRLQDALQYEPTDLQAAVAHNGAMLQSAPLPSVRHAFMQDIKTMSFKRAVHRYCPKLTLWRRLMGKCKRLLCGG